MTQLDPQLDPKVLDDVLALIDELSGDWEFDGEITPETRFLADLGLESLDLVVLGTMIQQRYGQLPFAEFYAEIGQRPIEERDVSVVGARRVHLHEPCPARLGARLTWAKTLLIGLDGATFTVLDPLMERGVMPFLRNLVDGRRPGAAAHGRAAADAAGLDVADDRQAAGRARRLRLLPEGDARQRVLPLRQLAGHRQRHDLVAGERARQARHRAQLPADVPAARRRRLRRAGRAGCRGASCGSAAIRRGSSTASRRCRASSRRELSLDMKLEEKAIEGCADEEYADWIELHTRREQRWFEVLRYLRRGGGAGRPRRRHVRRRRQAPAPLLAVPRPGAAARAARRRGRPR